MAKRGHRGASIGGGKWGRGCPGVLEVKLMPRAGSGGYLFPLRWCIRLRPEELAELLKLSSTRLHQRKLPRAIRRIAAAAYRREPPLGLEMLTKYEVITEDAMLRLDLAPASLTSAPEQ